MLSLPSLEPRDSYTLWYTSSTSPNPPPFVEPTNPHETLPTQGQNAGPHPHRRHNAIHRTPLSRLRLDEEYMERRKQNIQNYGNSWIKPPGIPKSLYQLREEEREMKEHQEALRREALAQELAEAEAEGADELLQEEGADGEMEEARDLDDDVPDAETTGLEADDIDAEEEEEEVAGIEQVPRGVLASRVPDDVYREAMIRGEDARPGTFGDDGSSTADEEDPSQLLQEEDLIHDHRPHEDMDMDMDADLDAEVPDGDMGGYEHTDTEDELTSSSDDDESLDHGRLPNRIPISTSLIRSDGTQNSMDLGSIISNGSSSPQDAFDQRRHSRRS